MQAKLSYGDEEVRMAGQPFPLYPGEELILQPTPLTIVACQSALRLTAIRDFDDKVAGHRLVCPPVKPVVLKSSRHSAARTTHTVMSDDSFLQHTTIPELADSQPA
jgi:hypothetical protein